MRKLSTQCMDDLEKKVKKIFNFSIKILCLLIPLFAIFLFGGCAFDKENEENSINVYSWGEFIANGTDGNINVNKEFTKRTGIKVNYKTFQNNEELFAKLVGGGADYDVIIPSDYMISRLIENDMLAPLNFDNIPSYNLIDEKFKNLNFDPQNKYSVPYMWGLIGIFYNKKEVSIPESEINWDILWETKYKNKILMFDNARDSFAISLLRLGYSLNTTEPSNWREAADELISFRAFHFIRRIDRNKVNLYGIFQSPVNNSVIVNNRISFYSFQLLHIESLNVCCLQFGKCDFSFLEIRNDNALCHT